MNGKQKLSIEKLLQEFSIDKNDFETFFGFYNDKFQEYDNKVYKDFRVRLVHLKYFLQDSWWNDRFYFLWKYYKNYKQIIDLGFSVPYLPIYLYKQNRLNMLPDMLYVDGNETSQKLAINILNKIGISVDFVVGDMQGKPTWQLIQKKMKNGNKLFCSFETIEHLNRPGDFWKCMSSHHGSDMIVSLPIGEKIPSHNLSFNNEKEVSNYLREYIEIKEKKVFNGEKYGSSYSIYTAFGIIKVKRAII